MGLKTTCTHFFSLPLKVKARWYAVINNLKQGKGRVQKEDIVSGVVTAECAITSYQNCSPSLSSTIDIEGNGPLGPHLLHLH